MVLRKFPVAFWNTRQMLVLYALTYCIVVGVLYHAVSQVFANVEGYAYSPSTTWLFTLSCVLSMVPVCYLPLHSPRVSSSILWIIFYIFYIPSIVIPQYILKHQEFSVSIWMLLLFFGYTVTVLGHYVRVFDLPRPNVSFQGYFIFLCLFWCIFMGILYKNFGLKMDFASLKDVYGQRSEFKSEVASSGSVIIGYIIILSGYWLAPVMFLSGVYYIRNKLKYGWWTIAMGVILSAYVYSIAAFKSIALSFVVVFLYARLMRARGGVGAKIFFGIMMVVGVSWFLAGISGFDFVAHQLVRRLLLVTGMNSTYFFDYFHGSITLDYGLLPSQAISEQYYGTDGNANAGYLASGYASFGPAGVLLVGASMAVALWLSNVVTKRMPLVFVSAGLFMQSYAISNTAFGTVMVSYGFLMTLVTFYLCPFREITEIGYLGHKS